MISKYKASLLLTLFVVGCSFLQGVNEGQASALVRQIRVGSVVLIYILLISIVAAISENKLKVSIPLHFSIMIIYIFISLLSLVGHEEWLFGVWKIIEFGMYVLWVLVVGVLLGSRVTAAAYWGLTATLLLVVSSVVFSIIAEPGLAWNYIPSAIPLQLRGGYLPINSNDLAMILLTGIIYCRVAMPKIRYRNILITVMIALLFATQNRTCILYFAIFGLFNFRMGWALGVGGLALSVINFSSISYIQEVITRGDINNILTGNGRLIIWSGVVDQMSGSLFLGKGFYVGHRFTSFESGHFFLDQPNTFDNTFLDISFDTGLIGLILFIVFLFTMTYRIYHSRSCMIASDYLLFLRWLMPFFLLDAMMGPTVQTFGLTLAIYSLAFLPAFTNILSLHKSRTKLAGPMNSNLPVRAIK